MLDIALAEESNSSYVLSKSYVLQFLGDPGQFAMRGEDIRYRQFSFLAAFLLYDKNTYEQETYLKVLNDEYCRIDFASGFFIKKKLAGFFKRYWEYQTVLRHNKITVDPRMVDYLLKNLAEGRDEYLIQYFGYSFVAVKILEEMADTLCLM